MWNPFRARVETRGNYTDALTSLLLREASGSPIGSASATAAVEAAVGLWAHAFAGARLEPEVPALDAFTLSRIARDLIVSGESLHVIDVEGGGLKLLPVGDHDVQGRSPDPASWIYRCSLYGPDGGTTRTVPAAGIVHIRYSVDPARPWKGKGPLGRAALDANLLSAIVTRLGEESGAPVAHVIPSPTDGQAASTETLRSDLKAAKGGVVLAETMASGYGDKASAPAQDWSVRRIGANPPAVLPALAEATGMRIAAALGVPVSLLTDADGVSQRESWRRFIWGSCAPLSRIIGHELSAKLDLPDLKFDFSALYASDVTGRAAAFKRLVESGMPISEAASITGLVAADDG